MRLITILSYFLLFSCCGQLENGKCFKYKQYPFEKYTYLKVRAESNDYYLALYKSGKIASTSLSRLDYWESIFEVKCPDTLYFTIDDLEDLEGAMSYVNISIKEGNLVKEVE